MTNSKDLFSELVNRVTVHESREEIESMIRLVLHHQLRLSWTDILTGKTIPSVEVSRFDEIIQRINTEEPVQYILGEADFYGRTFLVDPSVLIPRPETELIVDEVLSMEMPAEKKGFAILDMGTGSGCLAVTLALEWPNVSVNATDISAAALMTAAENARRLGAEVAFSLHSIFHDDPPIAQADVIVSNPPYVTVHEKSDMKRTVKEFEPAEALFVADANPLLFYEAIVRVAGKILRPGGRVVVEINEQFGREVSELFARGGLTKVRVIRDVTGKDRIVTGEH